MAWGHSPALNLDIYWGDIHLQYFDPVAGEWLLGLKEAQAEIQEVRAELRERQRRVLELEDELRRRG